jgi:hypothetical protein
MIMSGIYQFHQKVVLLVFNSNRESILVDIKKDLIKVDKIAILLLKNIIFNESLYSNCV